MLLNNLFKYLFIYNFEKTIFIMLQLYKIHKYNDIANIELINLGCLSPRNMDKKNRSFAKGKSNVAQVKKMEIRYNLKKVRIWIK